MIKSNKNVKKSMKNHVFAGFNVLLILTLIVFGAGCVGPEDPDDITGTYMKDDKTTLQVFENKTYFFKLRVGYLMGREVNQTVTGTYTIEDDKVIFVGDGVRTTAYIQGENLIIEGNKYTRQNTKTAATT